MHHVSRTASVAVLVATLALTAGCGGGTGSKPDALQAVKAAKAAEASASAAIAALSSKLGALTSSAATSAAAPAGATSAPAATSSTTSTSATTTTGATTAAAAQTSAAPAPAPTSAPAAAAPSGLAALKSQANAVLGGALAATDVSKFCSAIPLADVQALIKGPVSTVIDNPYQCGWTGTGLEVSVNPNDANPNGEASLVTYQGHLLAGLGDKAEWNEPVTGMTLPNLYAIKGKMTCYVQADDVPKSTIHYTGKDPFFKIADADSLAYATKEAKLCADVFAVG